MACTFQPVLDDHVIVQLPSVSPPLATRGEMIGSYIFLGTLRLSWPQLTTVSKTADDLE